MKILHFEDLDIWKESLEATQKIYSLSAKGELSRDYALRDQMRRSVISISANIAEGFERNNNNEFIRFLYIAKGSVGETRSHLYVARKLSYITEPEFASHNDQLLALAQHIGGFIMYLSERKRVGEFNKKAIR